MMASRNNRKRQIGYGLVLVVLTTVLALVLCEILIRLSHPDWQQPRLHLSSEITHDPVQGWIGRPGFSEDVGPNHTHIRINEQGYRDEDFVKKLQQAEAKDLTRLLFIGDSLMYGYRIPESERLSEQVADVAKARRIGIETFNAGMPGYGTGQELRALENLLPVVRPEVVVMWYCSNDIGDSALPYDYRLAHRVYKPFYDLDGRLICHETVPVRFSYRVQDTWMGGWQLCYFVDWLRYQREDRTFSSHIHLWDSPRLSDPPTLTEVQKKQFLRNLGAMALIPELIPIFTVNLDRNFALWDRMNALCQERGVRFIMLFDSTDGTETTSQVMERVAGMGIDVLDYGDRLDPYRSWAGVWGDGHPNAIQNYVAAIAVVDELDASLHTADFTQASWIDSIPGHLDLGGAPWLHVLNGVWGSYQPSGREAGTQARGMLRAPPAGKKAELLVRGTCLEQGAHIRLWCGGHLVGEITGTAGSPFFLVGPVDGGHHGLLLLQIEADPHVMIREIRVRPVYAPGTAESE